jgi:hypothetical protein
MRSMNDDQDKQTRWVQVPKEVPRPQSAVEYDLEVARHKVRYQSQLKAKFWTRRKPELVVTDDDETDRGNSQSQEA